MTLINRNLSEEDTKRLEITPAITNSGWDPRSQIRMEYSFTNGRIMVKDKEIRKGKKKKADYLLFYKPNFPIAIVEAKKFHRGVSDGLQQGMAYAECFFDYTFEKQQKIRNKNKST